MPTDASQIGAALKEAREAAGISQAAAARHVGVDTMTISRYERGERKPKRPTLVMLELLYKLPPGTFDESRNGLDNVSRGTRALGETWEPTPTLRGMVPQRVYDVAISYCRRLAAAGLPRDEVEEAERLLIDPAYAKLNRRAKRELTEDEQIQIIDATWSVMQEVLSWKGVRA